MSSKYKNIIFFCILSVAFISCNSNQGNNDELHPDEEILSRNARVSENIQSRLSQAIDQDGVIGDGIKIEFYNAVEEYYYLNEYMPIWSDTGVWRPYAKELISYYDAAMLDGLFKNDYHFEKFAALKKKLDADSVPTENTSFVSSWAAADILLTDAFMHILCDLKQGRLISDSNSWKNDTTKFISFFAAHLDSVRKGKQLIEVFRSVEPRNTDYAELKKGIKQFTDSMDTKDYTYLIYPYKKEHPDDSLAFLKKLQLRLSESGIMNVNHISLPDSTELSAAIIRYQKRKNLRPDGKISAGLINTLNFTDKEKFIRIAITLDRYKLLPETLPEKFIWVNLAGYQLKVLEKDTIRILSKIICGKPNTPTPILTSNISDIIIYPTWTVPTSIIKKEMLPGLKRNPAYLRKRGLQLINSSGERVDPSAVNWAKYSNGIPYKVLQESGDGNALGVMKFNFENPYAVYLHDTNQRYFFKNSYRALSHGCVRVEQWRELADYIVRNDSLMAKPTDSISCTTDSISVWLSMKKRRQIKVENKIPLYIHYFTCEGVNGRVKFHEDIYGEDKKLKEIFFAGK